ncbi:hypothetical protein ABIB60_003080 [Hymenobacter sp. UYP22]
MPPSIKCLVERPSRWSRQMTTVSPGRAYASSCSQLALQRQQVAGPPALPAHLAQLSPARFVHLNRLGRYSFQLPADVLVNGLRPLRLLP